MMIAVVIAVVILSKVSVLFDCKLSDNRVSIVVLQLSLF